MRRGIDQLLRRLVQAIGFPAAWNPIGSPGTPRMILIMKLLLLLAIIAVGGFFGYPLINEDTSTECDALEKIAVRVFSDDKDRRPQTPDGLAGQVLGQLLQGASKGQFAQAAVRDKFPDLPVGAACALLYWKAMVDPEGFRKEPLRLKP